MSHVVNASKHHRSSMVEDHLAASARAMKRILASKRSAREALIKAGILDKSGKGLSKPYR